MLKRTAVRLLLFGIPFTVSYFVSRPVVDPAPQFPIQRRDLVISIDRTGRIVLTQPLHLSETKGERFPALPGTAHFRMNQ